MASTGGPNASATLVDLAAYKDRLGSIVRSKEGIMVNVSSPLPFNLHNKPRALLDIMAQGSYLSSSSRSASTSTFHEGQSPAQHHMPHPRPPFRVRSGLRITPLHSTPNSRSRSVSQSSASSAASREPREEKIEVSPPGVLGVRLVRGPDTGDGYVEPRGRAQGKKAEGAEMEIEAAETSSLDDAENFVAFPRDDYPHPQVSISPASDRFQFRLHEVGALSASWGD
ncbi:hypothetical protein DXG01_008381 [Tephrocybe rancida]|nr:hypothetical protein DXG01_008381 [Tephrocybe rancida]